MLQCFIAHPHTFLNLDYFYFSPKTKLSRRGQGRQSPARGRELKKGGRVVCECDSCVFDGYVQHVCSSGC